MAKLKISFWQKVCAALLVVGFTLNGFIDFNSFQVSIEKSRIFSEGESAASSLMILQGESLVYVYRLSQWSHGEITRRELQISRATLAQRLNVRDSDGLVLATRIGPQFLLYIENSDAVVASSVSGILPEKLQLDIRNQLTPIINGVTQETRAILQLYKQNLDLKIISVAREYQNLVKQSL